MELTQLWPLLFNHLWQSTLFAVLLLASAVVLRRSSAALRYALYLVGSAKFIFPSFLVVLTLRYFRVDLENQLPVLGLLSVDLAGWLSALMPSGGGGAASPGVSPLRPIYLSLTALWAAGALGFQLLWLVRRRQFVRHLARATPVTSGLAREVFERGLKRLGIRRRVELVTLPGAVEVGVWGSLRPKVILPEEMADHLSPSELEAVLLHELIHVRRWDNLVANVHMVLCCILWFHPVVWLLDRRLLAEREQACDEKVVELCGGPETYAQGLVKAVRFGLGWRLAGVSTASASNLRQRIERICSGDLGEPPSRLQRAFVGAGFAWLFVFSVGAGTSAWNHVPGPGCEDTGYVEKALRYDEAVADPASLRDDRGQGIRLPESPPQPRECTLYLSSQHRASK